MRDTEFLEEDTAPVKIEKEEDSGAPAAQIVELELQVQNLEQLVAKAQEEKEQNKEELTAEIYKKKGEVGVWKYCASQCFRWLKNVMKKLKNNKKKKSETLQSNDSMLEQEWARTLEVLKVFCRGKELCEDT